MRALRTSVAELWEARCVRAYVRTYDESCASESPANQRAFVLRMNGSRCAHGAALTSKIENVIQRISRGRDWVPN